MEESSLKDTKTHHGSVSSAMVPVALVIAQKERS